MKPVMQEFLHNPETGVFGDCFRAVIASLLDLPIADVPHFFLYDPGPEDGWPIVNRWLAPHGLAYICFGGSFDIQEWMKNNGVTDVWHEIGGPSPRFADAFHSVVGHNGSIAHDPHPDGTGLAGNPRETWTYGFLVRINAGSLS
jgi:hypothetical protein